jgi:membrane protein
LWLVGSLALRVYVVHWGRYETTYGAIGAVIVVLLWFWWMGLALVIGAELDEIEHASPWGRGRDGPPAPPVPVGLAAAREHDERARLTSVPGPVSARR